MTTATVSAMPIRKSPSTGRRTGAEGEPHQAGRHRMEIISLFGLGFSPAFPQLHIFHLVAALPCQRFASKGLGFLVAIFCFVLFGGESVGGKMLLGDDLEGLSALEAGNRSFFDGLLRVHSRGGAFSLTGDQLARAHGGDAVCHGPDHADDLVFCHWPRTGLGFHDLKGALKVVVHIVPLGRLVVDSEICTLSPYKMAIKWFLSRKIA